MSYKLKHTAEAIDDKLSLINKNKNLLPYPYEESSWGNLIDVGDGSFLTNTDYLETGYEFLLHTVVLPGGKKYKISIDIADFIDESGMTENPGFSLIVRDKSGTDLELNNEILDFSAKTEETSISVFLDVPVGSRANLIVKPQIEEGEEQTAWKPYMKDIANYVDERFNSTNVKIKAIAEAVANNAGSSEYTGPENIEDGTTTGIQQIQDQESGVTAGYFNFTNKNQHATKADNSLTGEIEYGATGEFAVALGGKSAAIGKRSMAVGTTTIAKGKYSFACGDNSVTLGNDSAAFGYENTAAGQASLAVGSGTQAIGKASTSLGKDTIAEGDYSLAGGFESKAKHFGSTVLGKGLETVADDQIVVGRYNNTLFKYSDNFESPIFTVGCGEDGNSRENALTITSDGTMFVGNSPYEDKSNHIVTLSKNREYVWPNIESYDDENSNWVRHLGTHVPIQSVTNSAVNYGSLTVAKSWAGADTLVQRTENGQIIAADPTEDKQLATKKYVDDTKAGVKETLIKLFDRDDFYTEVSSGTLTLALSCTYNDPVGDHTQDCSHEISLVFTDAKNNSSSDTLTLPAGATIKITGTSAGCDTHYFEDGESKMDVGIGNGGDYPAFNFYPFDIEGNKYIEVTYSNNSKSDYTLYQDMSEASGLLSESSFSGSPDHDTYITHTLNYTIYDNPYLKAINEL